MLRFYSLLQIYKFLFLSLFIFSVLKHADCECVFRNPCECVFTNGSVIDLSSLGNTNNVARFQNKKAIKPADNYTYFYNPCYSFKIGNGACAKGVSVCQVSLNSKEYYDVGDSDTVHFFDSKDTLYLIYSALPRTTNVTLVCSEDAIEPELTVQGETAKGSMKYKMTLKSRCACPDLCRVSHLSAGSVLVIIFLIFVSLYLVLGIIHSSLTRGAHGWELLPHYEFWADFPLLVRDGCVFVVSGCKAETAYERI